MIWIMCGDLFRRVMAERVLVMRPSFAKCRERAVKRFWSEADFSRQIHQGPVQPQRTAVGVGREDEIVQHTFASRADIAPLQPTRRA